MILFAGGATPMLQPYRTPLPMRAVLAALAVSLAAPAAWAAGYERPIDRRFEAADVRTLELENLAGRVEVVASESTALRVTGTVFAEESAGESARALGESLEVEFEQSGGRVLVRAVYPTGEHRRYHYPRRQGGDADGSWLFDFVGSWTSNTRYQGRDVRVTASSGGGAATLYADFRLEVPAGLAVVVKNFVGEIESDGVVGDQTLDTTSGPIFARRGRGELVADTGSGDVVVEDHEGSVHADTGSGDVELVRVKGERLSGDTGSGDVTLVDCAGSVDADTGSGNVVAKNLVAGRSLRADTGSGDVRIEGDLSAVRRLDIDTGSGDVSLRLAATPSVRLTISTGSGDIDLDLADARLTRARRGDYVAELAGGAGDGVIDTGSGDVTIVGP
jgi:hypothetical protein